MHIYRDVLGRHGLVCRLRDWRYPGVSYPAWARIEHTVLMWTGEARKHGYRRIRVLPCCHCRSGIKDVDRVGNSHEQM